jgi:hypothetical protein
MRTARDAFAAFGPAARDDVFAPIVNLGFDPVLCHSGLIVPACLWRFTFAGLFFAVYPCGFPLRRVSE